jgi:hypothetical protein
MTKRIPLTKGQFAPVDDADYEWLMQWHWRLNSHGYAVRSSYHNGYQTLVSMHRLILNTQPVQFVDHIDHNRLNNTRANLRFVTHQQNQRYRHLFRNTSTGLKGVSRFRGQWHARIGLDGRIVHLGFFDDMEKAAQAHDAAARHMFREFAILNFPDCPTPPEIEVLVEQVLARYPHEAA